MTSPDDLAGKVREGHEATLPSRTDPPYQAEFEAALAALLALVEEQRDATQRQYEAAGEWSRRALRAEDALRVAREALRDFAALDLYAMKHLADMDARAIDYADYAVLLKAQEKARAAIPQAEDGA